MQTGNLSTVNFGALYYYKSDNKPLTKAQNEAIKKIEPRLSLLETQLEKSLKADIIAKFKSNGDISLSVSKRKVFPDGTIDRYIPCGANGHEKLIVNFDLKDGFKPYMVKKGIDKFAKMCKAYMKKPFCAQNTKIETAWEQEEDKQVLALYSRSK